MLVRRDRVLSVLTSGQAITQVTGFAADPEGIAFGDDGFLYVTDDIADAVVRIDPETGTPILHTSQADFEALEGITEVNFENPIVGSDGASIFVASEGTPQAIFQIAPDGTPSVLVSGDPLQELDGFMTRAPNGDLVFADDGPDTVYGLTPVAGAPLQTLVTEAQVLALTGEACADFSGGIAFDDQGNFYLSDSDSGDLLRFDTAGNGGVLVSRDAIEAVTGSFTDIEGIAFSP